MHVLDKNNVLLGKHGFPATVASADDIIKILYVYGNVLMDLQQEAIMGFEKPLTAKPDTSVRNLPSNRIYMQAEFDIFNLIKRALQPHCGESKAIGFLAMEEQHATSHQVYWVVDPLCNLNDYLRNGNNWSISIGFAVNGNPTGGAVFYPSKGQMFYTGDDGKSYLCDMNEPDSKDTVVEIAALKPSDGIGLRPTMIVEFAKQAKGSHFSSANPDLITNVALAAIVKRIEVKPHFNIDFPLALTPQ